MQRKAFDRQLIEEELCSMARRAGEPLGAVVEYALQGGKRLRGLLTMAIGGSFPLPEETFRTAAATVELLHAATLVQDDIFDRSRVRRGRPAVHCAFDPRLATLASDWMLAEALRSAYRLHACFGEAMSLCAERMIAGEARELAPSVASTLAAVRARAVAVARAKTGELFAIAASAPALLCGEARAASQFYELGIELGLAFQYADDALDLYGDEASAGKPLTRDLEARLRTVPVLDACGLLPQEIGKALLREQHTQTVARALREETPRRAVLGFAAAHWQAATMAILAALPENLALQMLLEAYEPPFLPNLPAASAAERPAA